MNLTYSGVYNGARLMDELLAAFPEWIVEIDGERRVLLYVQTSEDEVSLEFPDGADIEALNAVVEAHDPEALSPLEQERAERAAQIEGLREADPELLDADDYAGESALISTLARKVALLELEMTELRDRLGL
jgi:hypothetical protein